MPKVLVSSCLLGFNVRYDGRNSLVEHPLIQQLKNEERLIPFCPEVAGGLSTPRPPAEIVSRHPILIHTDRGDDVTPEFLHGAELALEKAKSVGACCALLKSRSPSCGNRESYDGSFTGKLVPESGVAAAELQRNGIPVFNEHELEQMEEFLESIMDWAHCDIDDDTNPFQAKANCA
jgi:uncharacterized protein YbbK (DUF523 family)